jgi:hypothetical protein
MKNTCSHATEGEAIMQRSVGKVEIEGRGHERNVVVRPDVWETSDEVSRASRREAKVGGFISTRIFCLPVGRQVSFFLRLEKMKE